MLFQSLVRAYKRSDVVSSATIGKLPKGFNPSFGLTSVPTCVLRLSFKLIKLVSIPRSGLQAFRLEWAAWSFAVRFCFNPSFGLTSVPTLGAAAYAMEAYLFQSLVRAYKRSDFERVFQAPTSQSFQSLVRAYKRSDRMMIEGIRSESRFQSLVRAYKRSDGGCDDVLLPV